MSGELRERIAAYVDAHPGCSSSAITKALGSYSGPTCRAISRLAFMGRIYNAGDSKKSAWHSCETSPGPTPPASDEAPPTSRSTTIRDSIPGVPVVTRVIDACKRGPVALGDLCDRLDLPPGKVRQAVEEARAAGIRLEVSGSLVGLRPPEPSSDVLTTGIHPVVGQRQRVAVISDLHAGSKYVMAEQLRDFVGYAYGLGVREVMIPGDLLDGCYRHGQWELTHHGLEEQAEALADLLPCLDGLHYRAITGNHDETFWEGTGVNVGMAIEATFRERGRSDLHFYGDRGARLMVYGADIHLWHPRGSGAYAASYKLQKQIEQYSPGDKPDILLCGHYHRMCYLDERGVHGLLCPTFQAGGSRFGKSLGGAPVIGGLILSWDLTSGGTLRDFDFEARRYFKREVIHRIAEPVNDPAPKFARCS